MITTKFGLCKVHCGRPRRLLGCARSVCEVFETHIFGKCENMPKSRSKVPLGRRVSPGKTSDVGTKDRKTSKVDSKPASAKIAASVSAFVGQRALTLVPPFTLTIRSYIADWLFGMLASSSPIGETVLSHGSRNLALNPFGSSWPKTMASKDKSPLRCFREAQGAECPRVLHAARNGDHGHKYIHQWRVSYWEPIVDNVCVLGSLVRSGLGCLRQTESGQTCRDRYDA